MIPVVISLATFISTFFGGLFALRFKDKHHLILGFSAGAVIGVTFFDLLPEAINLGSVVYTISTILTIVVAGFMAYMILDRVIEMHSHHNDHEHEHENYRGEIGASSFSIHSFFDGAAIGLAFQVSAAVGIIVAVAVLVHDFSDGINTVTIVLKNHGNKKEAMRWLLVDAVAPVIGVLSTFLFQLPETTLGIVLAVFAGFFLYIGASDLLPESHHGHPTRWTTFMTILGATVLFIAIKIAAL